jgi:hypothetical protein
MPPPKMSDSDTWRLMRGAARPTDPLPRARDVLVQLGGLRSGSAGREGGAGCGGWRSGVGPHDCLTQIAVARADDEEYNAERGSGQAGGIRTRARSVLS